jgi:hypothetical protein
METVVKITAFIVTLCILLCFDAIMNYVLVDKSIYWKIPTGIGRFAVGWFAAPVLYAYIVEQLNS